MTKPFYPSHSQRVFSTIFKLLLCLLYLKICNNTTIASYFDFTLGTTPLVPATNGFKIKGSAASSRFGISVSTAGDIDNDGYDDIIIGGYVYDNGRGLAYVIYGKDTSTLADIDLSLTSLDPHIGGFSIVGNAYNDYLGYSVGTAGDIDKDGYDDIFVGAYGKNTGQGAVYVIYGGPKVSRANINLATALTPNSNGFTITGMSSSYFGFSVNTAGDINKDGYADIIIGAFYKTGQAGAAYVIYGGPRSTMNNIVLSSTPLDPLTTGFTITGSANNDNLGLSVSTAGDINKDGYADIIIGARGKNSGRGAAYVIYGGEKTSMRHWDFSTAGTALDPATTGFMLSGETANDRFGTSVSTAGDINNDGYADIIIGASDKNSGAGAAYVIYGGEKISMRNWDLNAGVTLDPLTTGFFIKGNAPSDYFGTSVSFAGDMNKDGYNDMIIGAYSKSSNQGAAYVIYGGPKTLMANLDLSLASTLNSLTTGFQITGYSTSSFFGVSVSIAGDFNKDGSMDLIIGAFGENAFTGAAYVIHTACSPCWNCQGHCDTCPSSSTVCTLCTSPYLLHQSQCVSPCPDTTFPSATTCEDCSTNCNKCSSLAVCTECISPSFLYLSHCVDTCPDTFFGSTSTGSCESCEPNCNKCSDSSSCNECTSPFLLYHSHCIATCPTSTAIYPGKCEDCPENCFYCTSKDSCQVCSPGYALENYTCITIPSSSYQRDQEKASRAISSATQVLGGIVCVGSVTFPVTALVSTIVQNTRYLNLSVTTNLAEIYKTWNTDLISWDVPNLISDFDEFPEAPPLFYRYELGSSFLNNFWPTLVNIAIGLVTFITCFVLKKLLEASEYNRGWAYSLLQKLLLGSFNFTLIQAYACMDNILFYLVIDAKTNPFNSFFSWASLISAVVFLALGSFLVFFNFWTIKKYQDIKRQNPKDLDAFNERNKYWELFYSDFNDEDLLSQSFLACLIIRSTLSSFIVTVLYDYPIMQTSFLIVLDGVMIIYLLLENPFKTYRGMLCQYYFETITLLVHLCTFILALQDTFQVSSSTLRTILSTGIIYLNTALVSGSIGFMFIEIYKTLSEKRRARRLKNQMRSVHPLPEDSQETQNLNQTTNPAHNPSPPRQLNDPKKEQDSSPENFHFFPGVQPNRNYNQSDSRRKMEPSHFFLDSNFHGETSIFSEMNTSQIINENNRDQGIQPMMIQRRPRIQRPNPQRNRFGLANSSLNPEQF